MSLSALTLSSVSFYTFQTTIHNALLGREYCCGLAVFFGRENAIHKYIAPPFSLVKSFDKVGWWSNGAKNLQ